MSTSSDNSLIRIAEALERIASVLDPKVIQVTKDDVQKDEADG